MSYESESLARNLSDFITKLKSGRIELVIKTEEAYPKDNTVISFRGTER
jgi:hypothetical protein